MGFRVSPGAPIAAGALALALFTSSTAAFEKVAPPEIAVPTPNGLIFEEMTLSNMRHPNGRECWTLHMNYASRLWETAEDNDWDRQRVATLLVSDIEAVFGQTRKAVVAIGESGLLPEVGAITVTVDQPGGRAHPNGHFTERTYFIGGDCR